MRNTFKPRPTRCQEFPHLEHDVFDLTVQLFDIDLHRRALILYEHSIELTTAMSVQILLVQSEITHSSISHVAHS